MTERLPNEHFTLDGNAVYDIDLQTLYHELRERLNNEAGAYAGFGTIQEMLIERAAFLYVYMKQQERGAEGIERPKAMTQLLRQWTAVLQEITRQAKPEIQHMKERILDRMVDILSAVLDDEVADPVRIRAIKERLANEMENVSF